MNKQTIIALSGRRKSGKNTVNNFIHSLAWHHLGLCETALIDDETGHLIVNTDERNLGVVDLENRNPEFRKFLYERVWGTIRNFSFASYLKDLCVDILGVDEQIIYGSNEDKEKLTDILWENLPVNPKEKKHGRTGRMTGRELLQYVGTSIFRAIDPEVWAKATMRQIVKSQTPICIITDLRFPEEINAVHAHGGKVIRLTRTVHPEDTHKSEIALDKDKYDWSNFDYVLDNQNLNIQETNEQIFNLLVQWEVVSV